MTPTLKLIQGDAMAVLKTLLSDSVHCVVTSPPFWGLRSYAADKSLELGLEPTLDEYLDRLVAVFEEVLRVLHPSGVVFCDIGDSYNSGQNPAGEDKTRASTLQGGKATQANSRRSWTSELAPKQRCLVPFRLALRLQSAGWWVRDVIAWTKPAPMPESVTDRCTQAWEPILMLTKSANYFWDQTAIKEPCAVDDIRGPRTFGDGGESRAMHRDNGRLYVPDGNGRNCRNVWAISPEPFTDSVPGPDRKPISHFAAYPSALVRRCVLAGSSARGVCPKCGEPWMRLMERIKGDNPAHRGSSFCDERDHATKHNLGNGEWTAETRTIGWGVGCDCEDGEPVPASVLDPFAGTFTTCAVALELGRNAIGIELSPQYCELGRRRCGAITPGLQLA